MDPLVVAGDVGERVDVLLGDLVPVGGAERPRPRPALSSSSPVIVRMAPRPYPAASVTGPLLARRRARACSTAAFFALPDSITDADGQPGQRAARLGQPDAVVRRALRRRAPSSCASGQEAADYRVEAYPGLPRRTARRCPTRSRAQWERAPALYEALGWSVLDEPRPRGRRPAAARSRAAEAEAGGTALILTGDRDMFQCAPTRSHVLLQRARQEGPERDRARRGARALRRRPRAGAGLHRAARRPVRRAARAPRASARRPPPTCCSATATSST